MPDYYFEIRFFLNYLFNFIFFLRVHKIGRYNDSQLYGTNTSFQSKLIVLPIYIDIAEKCGCQMLHFMPTFVHQVEKESKILFYLLNLRRCLIKIIFGNRVFWLILSLNSYYSKSYTSYKLSKIF